MRKPAHIISPYTQLSLLIAGLIGIKYSLSIIPINYNLTGVNLMLALTSTYQIYRKTKVPKELGGFWGKIN